MARFLNIYSEEETIGYENLLEQSIAKLPYTLSFPIIKTMSALEKQEYGNAMYRMLDFFEVSASF